MQRISEKGNENLGQLGYTDHSQKHCMQVAHHAEYGTLLANELFKKNGYDVGRQSNHRSSL